MNLNVNLPNEREDKFIRGLAHLFKINGNPADEEMSPGQMEIFRAIVLKVSPRIACLAPTGYGKSEAVAMGVIIRTCVMADPFIIASVKFGTSDIIMKKVIEHLFDSEDFTSQLELDSGQSWDRLKRERKKTKFNFKKGGRLKIISLFGKDSSVETGIGEHDANIILDESPLLTPTKYLQLLKILEGTGNYETTFLFELGNAVNRNHFRHNVKFNPDYYKIDISLKQAIAEGRLDQKSVDEKKDMPFYREFYLCEFPDEDEIDEKGYRQLVSFTVVENAVDDFDIPESGEMYLGVDVGGGGDSNVYTVRCGNFAWIEGHNQSNDTMTNVQEVIRIAEKYGISDRNIFVDDIGVGRGVSDRLAELGHHINGVSVGMPANDPTKFANLKAEAYWRLKVWLDDGGKLKNGVKWDQVTWIKYKINSDKVVGLESKQDQKKRTGKSPDFADSLMLTFITAPEAPSITFL